MTADSPLRSKSHPGPPRKLGRLSPAFALLLALTFSAAAAETTFIDGLRLKAQGKPNLILFLVDQLGPGDLGSYGQTLIRTPNFDRLAADGVRFTDAYVGGTDPIAALESLLTGRRPTHLQLPPNHSGAVGASETVLAGHLRIGGHTCAALGAWGLGGPGTTGHPLQNGFQEWLGYFEILQNPPYYPEWIWRQELRFEFTNNLAGRKGAYLPDTLTSAALRFIKDNRRRPFFLYLAYPSIRPNLDLAARTGNGFEVPDDHPYGQQPWSPTQKNRAAMITRLDADLGRIRERLQELQLTADTVLVLTSLSPPQPAPGFDPAFFNSTAGRTQGPDALHEGNLRVPLIIAWPGRIPSGTVQAEPTAAWDLAPTLADLAKGPVLFTDGTSLAPLLLGGVRTNAVEALYWPGPRPAPSDALRLGEWKILRPAPGQPVQLFKLKTDPREEQNLADSQPGQVARLTALMDEARRKPEASPHP